MKNNKNAITLIEIIIVTVILVVVWVVWMFAYTSYLVTVRDSTRLVELENVETSLWSYVLKSWFFPDPSNWQDITYSWSLVWTQWTFWKSVTTIVWYSKDVVDPLTNSEYAYSVKNSRKEYSIAWVLEERPGLVASNTLIWTANADVVWSKKWIAVVKWNYNWEVTSILLNWVTNVLAIPSIIASDLSSPDLVNILNNKKLVYNEFWNIPASFSWSVYSFAENINFAPNNLVVYSWSISKLKETYNQVLLLQNVRLAYSWSILWKNISVNRVDDTDLFSPQPSSKTKILACDLINFKLKYFVECWKIDFITFFVINVLGINIDNLPGTKITAVYQDHTGKFVFWTNQWLAFYDWIHWLSYDQGNSWLVHNYITSVTQDNLWNYWIWTQNWINKFVMWNFLDKSDDIWVTYNRNLLNSTHIQYVYTDNNWIVWVWTNQWVTSYNWEVWSDYIKKSDISHNNITAIYNDSAWYVWFWTNAKWVDRYKILDWTVTNYDTWKLPDHRVTYIFEATGWTIWVGTQWWLAKLPNHWASWQSYTNISTSWWLIADYITYLFQDTSWNIRVWTNNWLSKYNWTTWEHWNTWNWLWWNYIFLIYEDDTWHIMVFSNWWLDAIDTYWNVVSIP